MYKRILTAVITGVGFTLLFATCTKTTDSPIKFTSSINLVGTSLAADQKSTTMYFSTDNGVTFIPGVLPNKVGQTFKARVHDDATGKFVTSANFTPDWSGSNPAPTDVTSDTPDFTYTGTNVMKVSFTNKHCAFVASYWTGAWGGDEVGACCGGTDANNITQDLTNPNKYVMDNFWGDGVDAYFLLNPSTAYADQTLSMPIQTTSEGGIASGTGTYDQCAGTFTIATDYLFPGLTDLGILALGRATTSGSRMYAATNSTFFYSANAGGSWTPQSTSLASTPVRAITTPHVTADAHVFVATGSGVFASADRGVTWAASNSGLTSTDVTALIMNGTNIFAATNGGGVFLSTDDAATWTAINVGITNTNIVSLAVSGSDIYAGTAGGGAFHSANSGTLWTPIGSGIKNTFNVLAAAGSGVYAGTSNGIFYSNDNGSTWTVADTTNLIDIRAVAAQGSNVYAASHTGGVFYSSNNGATWKAINKGLTSSTSVSLESATTTSSATDPTAIRLFYGTSDAGAFVTANQGKGWSGVSAGTKYDWQYNFHKP